MNEFEFLEAINEIDDDLILSAQTIPVKKHRVHQLGARAAAVAAIICLLSITVAAVTISVRIFTSDREVPNYEYYYGGPLSLNSKITTIEYDLQPQKAEIPLKWTEELSKAWKSFGYDYGYFTGTNLKNSGGSRMDFGGITQLEQLLGIELAGSEEMELITNSAFVTLAVTDQERAAGQNRTEGIVSPDGLVVYLPLEMDMGDVDFCGLSIFVPLTESFAEQYASHAVLSSVWKQDLNQTRITSAGGIEIILLENTPSDGDPLSGFAAWEQNGIGYLVEIKTYPDSEMTPGELLMPYLEQLED